MAAYRLVQEALTNALKHAGSSTTEVTLSHRHDGVTIEVIDEGDGHPPANGDVARWRSRTGRDARANEPLRRRGRGGPAGRRRLRRPRAPAPPARGGDAHERDPGPARRRPGADPRRLSHDPRRRERHRGRRRVRERRAGDRQRQAPQAPRRPDGHPHARARRDRGDPAHPRGERRAPTSRCAC